ncbi:fungal-specific transcription factor domain-containing protein [Leptodontidium sp. 2 PMI_412]|nr:fungal-specific transcription factor domain-containing protein [Leptodontidium sp. 2 PMI_412]
MFANFEVCKAGLVTATPSRRHQRTSTGCLQCRQRKKKCDERRPICSSCLKYGTTCERGRNSKHHSRARSSSGLPGESGRPSPSNALAQSPSSDFSAYSIDSHCSLSSELVPLDSTYPVTTHSRIQDSLVQERHWNDFEVSFLSMGSNVRSLELVAFNLSSEHRVLDFLLEKIEALIMPRYISPKLSILYIALPLAVASPAMKNALMACGFALLSQASSGTEDSIQAKSYQCKALNDLAGNLLEGLEEQNLATILLLHLFEKITCDSVHSKRLHLLGANDFINSSQRAATSRSAPTRHHIQLIEACTYHIALSSTFSGISLPLFHTDHVSKLLELLRKASEDPRNMWKDSSLIGVSHDMLDAIFRTSLLLRQLPLTVPNRRYALELKEVVFNWQWDSPHGQVIEHGGETEPRPPETMIKTGELYRLACLLLLEKILEPSLRSSDQVPRNLVTEFCQLIRQLSPEDTKQSVYLWPLLIMGTAAETHSERELFLAPLQHNPNTFGFGNRTQGCTFLIRSWGLGESSDGVLGLDILLRDDLLCEVFI